MAQEDDQLGESQPEKSLLELAVLQGGILTLGWHHSMINQVHYRYQLFMTQQLSMNNFTNMAKQSTTMNHDIN